MKAKKLMIGVMALLMVGCSFKEETPSPRRVGKTIEGYKIREWQYEGHSYILYRNCIIHSESCKCKENKR